MRRIDSKIFKRFALSFLIVLVLPVTFFVYLFLSDFRQIYQSKVTEQAENALEAASRELDRHIESMHAIVNYNSQLPYLQSYAVKRDITGVEIRTTLNSEEAVHGILENICYYNAVKPNRIYTATGTYTLSYYAKLVMGLEDEQELFERWNSLEEEGWLHWEENSGGSSLQYIIETRNEERWIFTFSQEELEKILGKENSATLLTDSNGNELYFSKQRVGEDIREGYEITVTSQKGYFRLVRLSSEESLFSEVSEWQNRFWMMVILVLSAGFVLVLLLTFYNEYPIRKLQRYCVEKLQNIPESLAGMDIFMFSIKNIEEKMMVLEKRQNRERLLLQLIWDEECDTPTFRNSLEEAELFKQTSVYSVMVAVSQREGNCNKLALYMEMLDKEAYELHVVNNSAGNVVVMIAGMKYYSEQELAKELEKVVSAVKDNLNDDIRFFVGKKCEKLSEVCLSYKQAMLCRQSGEAEDGESIVFYKEENTNVPFQYPSEELKALYDALVDIDFEKASMITNVLLEILEKSNRKFVSVSLYYDVLNTYYRARKKLEMDEDSVFLDMNLFDLQDNESTIWMISQIREQFQLFIDSVREEKKEKHIISKVIAFIDENITSYDLSVSMVADHFNISISNLSHQFKAQMNCTISGYITEKKFAYASELLIETDYSVTMIAEMLGYSQARSFCRKFRQYYGVSPMEYRNKNRGEG